MDAYSKTSERTVEIAHEAMEFIRTHEKDAEFCLGYAWATLNSILVLHGQPKVTPPWSEEAK